MGLARIINSEEITRTRFIQIGEYIPWLGQGAWISCVRRMEHLVAIDNSRKAHLFYWIIQEVNKEALSHETTWFIGSLIRSNAIVKESLGGISGIFRRWVKLFFSDGGNFSAGVTIHSPRGPFTIVARLASILADDDAHRGIWCAKGSSGNKPCFKCANVVSVKSGWEGEEFVTVECDRPASFMLHTDESLWQSADKLKAVATDPLTTCARKEEVEKSEGLAWNADGLLWDRGLRQHVRPVSSYLDDWAHVFITTAPRTRPQKPHARRDPPSCVAISLAFVGAKRAQEMFCATTDEIQR